MPQFNPALNVHKSPEMVTMTVVVEKEMSHFIAARADRQGDHSGLFAGELLTDALLTLVADEVFKRVLHPKAMTAAQTRLAFVGSYPVMGLKEMSRRTGLSEGFLKSLANDGLIPGRAINPSKKQSYEFLRSTALGWCRSREVKQIFDAFPTRRKKRLRARS